MIPFSVIAALGRGCEIGTTVDGTPCLPWGTIPQDLRFFQAVTTATHPVKMASHFCHYPAATVAVAPGRSEPMLWPTDGNVLIGGWRTASTLPLPLPYRKVIQLRDRTSHGAGDWLLKARSLDEALRKAQILGAPNIFVIGGSALFREALQHPGCQRVFLTEIDAEFPEADRFFTPGYTRDGGRLHVAHALPDGTLAIEKYHRQTTSRWIETDPFRFRFGIWEREPSVTGPATLQDVHDALVATKHVILQVRQQITHLMKKEPTS